MSTMPSKSAAHCEALGEAEAAFYEARGQMHGVALRILGSAGEADDVLQEAWIRWQNHDRSTVKNSQAFLTTMATRLAINVRQSAKARREASAGLWLLDQADNLSDPALASVHHEAVEAAVLILMDKLTPAQRAAYVLREAFDYPYEQIASILGWSPAGARQLVSRARKNLAREKESTAAATNHQPFLTAFVEAAHTGDVNDLEELFVEQISSPSGSEDVARAAQFPADESPYGATGPSSGQHQASPRSSRGKRTTGSGGCRTAYQVPEHGDSDQLLEAPRATVEPRMSILRRPAEAAMPQVSRICGSALNTTPCTATPAGQTSQGDHMCDAPAATQATGRKDAPRDLANASPVLRTQRRPE
ncbi:sigma-70 family RNA polymerase sigma factor [Streptomyces fagopyri]|nr:sigma-70 family RNA polymerase sigma factor [Streptomyces fagopyri]